MTFYMTTCHAGCFGANLLINLLVQVDKMARLILALALLGVAQAFVPAAPLARAAPRAAVRKAASMEIDGLLGAIPPFG